jgi:predicted regulator of Ras-like GTPase activity (Roadblock/LC7/MglB family)
MGVTLFTACSPQLSRDAVGNAAFRFLSFLAESAEAHAVSQTTVRGAAGAMVLTPCGPLSAGGPVLAAAIPRRGALALLEILSLRVAAEHRAAAAGPAPPGAAPIAPDLPDGWPVSRFHEVPVPSRVDALARSLSGAGALRSVCLEDSTGRLLLYLLLAPDADPQRLGRFASDLYRVMEIEGEPGGVGPFQSVVVRLGSQQVVVRPISVSAGRSTMLVAATAGDARPGLAHLQLERVAARLATPSS